MHYWLRFDGLAGPLTRRAQATTSRLLCRRRILRFRAESHHFLTAGLEVRQINACKLVVRLALVHLLLDAAAALGRVGYVLFELGVGRWTVRVQDLQERADGLLDAFLVTPLDRLSQPNSLADLLVRVPVLSMLILALSPLPFFKTWVTASSLARIAEAPVGPTVLQNVDRSARASAPRFPHARRLLLALHPSTEAGLQSA